jgi:molybdopterin molybdotransferase
MISLAQARQLIVEKISPRPARSGSLSEACGRILLEDARAPEDLPAFDRSAMDGYAMSMTDDSPRFRVVGEIQPGEIPAFRVEQGECARIFTGAAIPEGASQVLMQEHTAREGDYVTPLQRPSATFIRRRGEDARTGDLLLASGTRLGPGELSLLATLGVARPCFSPAVRVAHFVTGNELIDASAAVTPGKVRDSNSVLVEAFVRQQGGEMVRQARVRDDFDLLLQTAREAEGSYDLLLVSGGASVGDYDFGGKLLRALGFVIHFDKMNLRPGKPLIFATREATAAFILPGNPVSHFVTLHAAVRGALARLSGGSVVWPSVKIRLAEDLNFRPDARETLWPGRVSVENGALAARALHWQSSGDVTGLAGANALLQMEGDAAAPKAGDSIAAVFLEVP